MKGVEGIKGLIGPVYDVETKHGYSETKSQTDAPKVLTGPVFKIDRQHGFDVVMEANPSMTTSNPCCLSILKTGPVRTLGASVCDFVSL